MYITATPHAVCAHAGRCMVGVMWGWAWGKHPVGAALVFECVSLWHVWMAARSPPSPPSPPLRHTHTHTCHVFGQGGVWDRKKYKGSELAGKVVGVVGLGNIGKEVRVVRLRW